MLSRRHIRIKIFQALYSYYKGSVSEIALGEKELMRSINKNYELFIHLLSILVELRNYEAKLIEDRKKKHLPTKEDKNPNVKFINNRLLLQLSKNADLIKSIEDYKISWTDEQEFIKKVHTKISTTESYNEYKSSEVDSYEEDAAIVIRLFKNQIADHEMLHHILEEKNIHWQDDHYFVCGYAVKILKQFNSKTATDYVLPGLFRDKEDDTAFITTVYRQVLLNNDEYQEVIMKKAKNWEADRIAAVDFILMKMALAELEKLSSIPIKVTLNEYIDISKSYSTPKSRLFINGVLDKIVADYKRDGKIEKRGRGLMN
jgi:N utilization substance protein B